MSLTTSIFSNWGNAVQGLFITWGNTAASSGTITPGLGSNAATTMLEIDLDLRLYGLGNQLEADVIAAGDVFKVYFLIQNPYDKEDYLVAKAADATAAPVHYNGWVNSGFDGALITYALTTTDVAADSLSADDKTMSIATATVADIACGTQITDNIYDSTNCVTDLSLAKTDDYADFGIPAGEHCTEKWMIYKNVYTTASPGSETATTGAFEKCVRI